MNSSDNTVQNLEPTSIIKTAFHVLLKAIEVAISSGLQIFPYKYPHPSVGGKVIFYYYHEHTNYFLLHTRGDKMTVNPGKIDAAGGYFNEKKDPNVVESTKREVLEEHGQAFFEALAPDFIRPDNVADTKCGTEPNPFYLEWGMDVTETYVSQIWYAKITKKIADLAVVGDDEVKEVIHLPLPEIHLANHTGNIVSDIYDTIQDGLHNHKIY